MKSKIKKKVERVSPKAKFFQGIMQRVKVVYGDVRLVLPIYDESVKVREQIEIFGAVIGSYLGTDPVKIAVMKTSDSFTFRNEDTLSHVVRPEDVLHLVDYKEYIEEQYKYLFFYSFSFPFFLFSSFPLFFFNFTFLVVSDLPL